MTPIYNKLFFLIFFSFFLNISAQNHNGKEAINKTSNSVFKCDTFITHDTYLQKDTIDNNKENDEGKAEGEWEKYYPNGNFRCKGNYKDGKKEGYWERKYPNGNWEYQINFKNGYPNGQAKWFYENGNLKIEGEYKNAYSNGLIKTYNENGKIRSEEYYIQEADSAHTVFFPTLGIVYEIKPSSFDSNCTVHVNRVYEINGIKNNGFSNGDVILYFDSTSIKGQFDLIRALYSKPKQDSLAAIAIYRPSIKKKLIVKVAITHCSKNEPQTKEILQGYCKFYDENGIMVREGEYVMGKREGKWKFYKKGVLDTIAIYHNDVVIKTEEPSK